MATATTNSGVPAQTNTGGATDANGQPLDLFSNPFYGSGSVFDSGGVNWDKLGQWAQGGPLGGRGPAMNKFQAQGIDPGQQAYSQIQNGYGSALGQALAGTQGRQAPTATAAQAAAPSGFTAAQMQGATVDPSAAKQWGDQQQGLANLLTQRAQGQSTSPAELQMRQGLAQTLNAQQSQAKSQRGVSAGLAARQLNQGATQAMGQTNQNAAILRAQEQQQAEQALGGVLQGARQQGQDFAAQQAQLQQQAGLQNALLQQQAGLQGQQLGTQVGLANAQMGTQTALANQQASLANQAQIDQATQAYIAMGMSREQAQQKANADYFNMLAQQNTANNQTNAGVAQQNADAQTKANAGVMGMAGSVLGSILSDRRAKKNITPADDAVTAMLDGIKPYEYEYKDPKDGPGSWLGVMAQDLGKSALGKLLVQQGEDGHLRIDSTKGLSALLAAAANLNQRVRKLEDEEASDATEDAGEQEAA